MNKLNKVVIPLAGLGTRMLPITKSVSKEMLPIAGIPIIQIIVEEALESGFKEIIFITREKKSSAKNHFERNLEFESNLEKNNKSSLREIRNITKLGINIKSVKQIKPQGLGHAILCAKTLISGEPFAVMLPDMILDANYKKNNLALMKKNFEKSGVSSILLGRVKKSDVQKYGIIKMEKKKHKISFFPIDDIIEKPSPKKAPSNLFVAGRYVFENEILSYLKKERPDSSGEIQLTGAVSNFLKDSNTINGFVLDGAIHDCGNKLGYLIANLAFSFKDPNFKKEVLKFIKK